MEIDLALTETWASLVKAGLGCYLRRAPCTHRMVELYRSHQELGESCFEHHRCHLLACLESSYARQITDQQLVLGYLCHDAGHRGLLAELIDREGLPCPPWWKQKILLASYGEAGLAPALVRRELFDRMDRLSDLEIVEANLNPYGGGKGRTPLGTYTEAVLSHYRVYCEGLEADNSSQDHFRNQLIELYYSLEAISKTIAKFREQLEIPGPALASVRVLSPSQVQQGLSSLSAPETLIMERVRPRSLSAPAVMRLPLEATLESVPLSPSTSSHLRNTLRQSVLVTIGVMRELSGWGDKFERALVETQPELAVLRQASQLEELDRAGMEEQLRLDSVTDESAYLEAFERLEAMWRLRELELVLEVAQSKGRQLAC